jgi:hypothetical protein
LHDTAAAGGVGEAGRLLGIENDVLKLTLALDVERDGVTVGESGGGGFEFGKVCNGDAVDGVNDVTGEEGVVRSVGNGDDGAGQFAERREQGGDALIKIDGMDGQLRDLILGAAEEREEAARILWAFKDGDEERQRFCIAKDIEGEGLAGALIDESAELAGRFDGFTGGTDHDVPGLQAGGTGRPVFGDVGEDGTGIDGELQSLGKSGGYGLGEDADLAAADATELADLIIDKADGVAGSSETDAVIGAGAREDKGVDAGDVAVGVNEGAAAIAGIDGGIGLDVFDGVIGAHLAGDGADDPHGDGVFQAVGATEGEDELTLAEAAGVGEGEMREIDAVDFEDSEISFAVEADELGGSEFACRFDAGVAG